MKTKYHKQLQLLFSLITVLISTLASNLATSAPAGPGKVVTLKFAHNLPEKHGLAQGFLAFKTEVEKRTNGGVKIELYPSAQLYADKNMVEAVRTGGVDIGSAADSYWGSLVPSVEILHVPYLVPSWESARKVMDGGVLDILAQEIEKKGAKVLWWSDYGFLVPGTVKKSVRKPSDMSGLVIRTSGTLDSIIVKDLGGSPSYISAGEMYMALQRGTVDGVNTLPTSMKDRSLWEVLKYVTLTNHTFTTAPVFINLDSWRALSPENQKVILDVAKDVQALDRARARQSEKDALEFMRSKGIEIVQIAPAEYPDWEKAASGARNEFLKKAGTLGSQLIDLAQSKR